MSYLENLKLLYKLIWTTVQSFGNLCDSSDTWNEFHQGNDHIPVYTPLVCLMFIFVPVRYPIDIQILHHRQITVRSNMTFKMTQKNMRLNEMLNDPPPLGQDWISWGLSGAPWPWFPPVLPISPPSFSASQPILTNMTSSYSYVE